MISTIKHTITERRTIRHFHDAPIAEELLYKLLEQAAYAPFHSKVEPWHVVVADNEETKMRFLDKVFESYERDGILKECTGSKLEKLRDSYKDAFVIPAVTLLISAHQCGDEKQDFEAVAATCAFIQNFQLLAWEAEIGVVWRSNPFIFDRQFANDLGVPDDHKIVGALQVGYFDTDKNQKVKGRRPLQQWIKKVQL